MHRGSRGREMTLLTFNGALASGTQALTLLGTL